MAYAWKQRILRCGASAMIDVEHLRQYSLFGGLADEPLQYLKDCMRKRTFVAGEVIFRQGDHGDEVCFLVSGSVRIVHDGYEVAQIHEGQQFGEMHLIDIMARSADVVGMNPGLLYILSAKDFLALKRRDAETYLMLMMNCSRDVSRRLRQMNERYVGLLKASGTQ